MKLLLRAALIYGTLCVVLGDQSNPEASDIQYILCTRSNRNGEDISYDDGSINSNFDGSRRTFAIAHGFSEDGSTSSWMDSMKELLLDKVDSNVILVNWKTLAAAPRYDLAAPNTKFVGNDLATLLDDLSSRGGLSGGDLHLIGFSLGAQVVAVAGNSFGGVDRISGLDPAAPLFEDSPSSDKLDESDASFVDVLHTNSGNLISGHLSFLENLGHVDFYPNGGHDQRGCPPLLGEVVINLADMTLDEIDACSHGRAPAYFITSLERSDFIAYECSSYENYESGSCTSNTNNIGYDANSGNPGEFFVETLVDSPYVASQIKTDFKMGSSGSGTLVLKNTISGLDEDEFEIFDGSVSSGETVTKIITASDGGVTDMGIKLQYDGSGSLTISSIDGEDIETGDKSCIGTNIDLSSGSEVSVSASSGSC